MEAPSSSAVNMADQQDVSQDIQALKSTRISVFVDEALPDILVVTYELGPKAFKGVLLDSTKRNLPCGIQTMNPAFKIPPKPNTGKTEEDVLYSVNQRFAYTDPDAPKRKNIRIASKYKNNKMTVRLRPRQVLCSKCKSICSENSENVSRKRKSSHHIVAPPKRASNAPITRSVHSELNSQREKLLGQGSLVPRLTRLTPQEENSVMERLRQGSKKPLIASNGNEQNTQLKSKTLNQEFENIDETDLDAKSGQRILRKKRSIGSMEDLWDETVFEENANSNAVTNPDEEPSVSAINTRTIKISYGPQGEGTVLKIPASTGENVDVGKVETDKGGDNKATRKALKRAKKAAKRQVFLTGTSPCYLTSGSPRYTIGGSSPRYTVGSASPRHGLGNNSPRYVYDVSIPIRRRKHKVKHKKRHKEDRDKKHNNKEGEVSSSTQDEFANQKLSINLKRLNNTYTSCPPLSPRGEVSKSDENGSSSDEHCEQVPDFPQSNPPLMLRINSQTISGALSSTGSRMSIGDVVWGKVQGFPWWPAKILSITNHCGGPQAHVSWYGSSTSSLMQCDQLSPYLENFKIRYNKKKKGMYKEAIKRATLEAKANEEIIIHPALVKSSPQQGASFMPQVHQVVPPALASPREIDVVS